MKNKAFTLVELLCVIIILAVISIIIFPNIGEIIGASKTSLKEVQINDIKKAAEKWAVDHPELLDKYHLNVSYLKLDDIQRMGYLEADDIIDPLTQNKMNGCVKIEYNQKIKQYQFEYSEDDCLKTAQSIKDKNLGSIQYIYSNRQLNIDTANSNQLIPTGLEVVNRNTIYSDGEMESGLYDIGEEYIFRGSDINNYILLSNGTSNSKWRIISIHKKDYSIKAIYESSSPGNFDNNSSIKFSESSSKEALTSKIDVLKVDENALWPVPIIQNINMSVSELSSIFSSNLSISPSKTDENKPIFSKVGLITVKDYVNASNNSECNRNFLSSSCSEGNYLKNMFNGANVWTMTNNGSQVWYVNDSGLLSLGSPTESYSLYPVISLNSNIYIESSETAIGSSIAPFVVK